MLPVANPQALEANPQLARLTLDIVKQAASHDAEIVPIGAAPLDLRPRIHTPTSGGTQWTITRIEDDPLTARGNIPVPSDQRRNLKNIRKTGVEFAELFIAHELPDRSFPQQTRRLGWAHRSRTRLAPPTRPSPHQPTNPPTVRQDRRTNRSSRQKHHQSSKLRPVDVESQQTRNRHIHSSNRSNSPRHPGDSRPDHHRSHHSLRPTTAR